MRTEDIVENMAAALSAQASSRGVLECEAIRCQGLLGMAIQGRIESEVIMPELTRHFDGAPESGICELGY